MWRWPLSADAARGLVDFWRQADPDTSALLHNFADPAWETRFLGDLYQDPSAEAKKKYALLQTPEFAEEFILDRTLEPALEEFGLAATRCIDPTCGSGHFLLGAFGRPTPTAYTSYDPSVVTPTTRVDRLRDLFDEATSAGR